MQRITPYDFSVDSIRSSIEEEETSDLDLIQVESWITNSVVGDDGWGQTKPFILIRLTTDSGIEGWGEAYSLRLREAAVVEIIHALCRAATTLESLCPFAFRRLANEIAAKNRGIDFSAASNAIEMAIWDIFGKQTGKPLYQLFGCNQPKPVPVYGNIWSETQWDANALAVRAAQLVDKGYRAIKIHPLKNHTIEKAAICVRQVREQIGDEIALMVDLDTPEDVDTALAISEKIAPMQPYWLEEPTDSENVNALAEIKQRIDLRIVTGETRYGVAHFRNLLKAQAADIINPDIAAVGGLLDLLEIAKLADADGVQVSPHCWNSMTVAAAAMLHVCAAIPNAEMAEIYPEYIGHGRSFATTGFFLDGSAAHLSDLPGLGVEIDVGLLSRQSSRNASFDPRSDRDFT